MVHRFFQIIRTLHGGLSRVGLTLSTLSRNPYTSNMSRILILFLTVLPVLVCSQTRNVSLLHENQMYSFSITRYAPAWEIQSETDEEKEGELAESNVPLFKRVDDEHVEQLATLLYRKGFAPDEMAGFDGKRMVDYLSKNRLVMHYRVRSGDHTVFLAHLNNSPTRSVIPFRIDRHGWHLDPGFAESDLFQLLEKPYFNVYTGAFDGLPYCQFAFEEVLPDGTVYDYSGRNNHARVSGMSVVNGRIGGGIRLNPNTDISIDLRHETELSGKRFAIDFHLMVDNSLFNKERKRVVFSVENELGTTLECSLQDGVMTIRGMGGISMELEYAADQWEHYQVAMSDGALSVSRDGKVVNTTGTQAVNLLSGAMIALGGRYSFKGMLDEFCVYH